MPSEDRLVRSEAEIVNDLTALASTSGYAHAIAGICFRDNVIHVQEKLDPVEIAKQFSDERLLRTEISTLVGLMIKAPVDITVPEPHALQEMIDRTDRLMKELHQSMAEPGRQHIQLALSDGNLDNPFTHGVFLREAIFYGGESAYLFQYRDLSVPKYSQDNDWLQNCKGFSIEDARTVIRSILEVQNEKIAATLESLRCKPMNEWTLLPGFIFATEEIEDISGIRPETVGNILASFTLPNGETNSSFQTVSDFNITNALPLLPLEKSKYLCFQGYAVAEALYESPFYWMLEDKSYATTASAHRGQFTEQYCADRLGKVFGRERVHKNVLVYRGKNIVAEIDVLVLFADRGIVVQAKSKRLTVEARKGNDNQLRDDFKRGIQAAYDQGRSSATLLLGADTRLVSRDGTTIEPKAPPSELYIFCVLSDHYPALAFQARQFLNIFTTDVIKPPFVMDVFTLDVITEFLSSPLYFLSYINRRVKYVEKVMASHELTILSYHLKKNLWVEPEYDLVHLGDDISADLDAAMLVRREGFPGDETPDGILTRFSNSTVGHLVKQIEQSEEITSINFGFVLLTLGEDTVNKLSAGIDTITKLSRSDGQHHDLTIGIGQGDTGITVHSNMEPDENARHKLGRHCEKRKYSQRAASWYGLCLYPENAWIRFGIALEFSWKQSDEMDKIVADMPKGGEKWNFRTYVDHGKRKVGRNEPCPCGSGKKYKKCCLNRER